MCGSFVLTSDLSTIEAAFDVDINDKLLRQSNRIVPGQTIAAIISDGRKHLVQLNWGLIPSWAKDSAIGRKMFNARAETIAEKPSFRSAFKKRRCLIIADGFYEWQKLGNTKKPFLFRLKSGQPFGFAGLYESWVAPDKQTLDTCTIITTEPNDLISPVHDRMPVILPKDKETIWLDPAIQNPVLLLPLLTPYPAEKMVKIEAAGLI
jgi:putative SOS response-associated peptidase YedK